MAPGMNTISPVCDKEWTAYVGVVMKLEICGIELVVRMIARNDVGEESSQLPTLPEAVDEQHVKCVILLTQPSQETQDDTTEEPCSLLVMKQWNLYAEVWVLVMSFLIRASFHVWILSQLP
jgi:hypothetical protein